MSTTSVPRGTLPDAATASSIETKSKHQVLKERNLPALLQSLAAGVRAVNKLPAPPASHSSSKRGKGGRDDDDDDFAFQSVFPEFAAALEQADMTVSETLREILREIDFALEEQHSDEHVSWKLWEQCADACDLLLEEVEAYLSNKTQSKGKGGGSVFAKAQRGLPTWSHKARQQSSQAYWATTEANTQQEVEKPQSLYPYNFPPCSKDSSIFTLRTQPFVPPCHPGKPYSKKPLDLTLQPGHGLNQHNSSKSAKSDQKQQDPAHFRLVWKVQPYSNLPDDLVAPFHHVAHPYAYELRNLEPIEPKPIDRDRVASSSRDGQHVHPAFPPLTPPSADREDKAPKIPFTWVDTVPALQIVGEQLKSAEQIAIDLEAHSYRTFAGMACLIQITMRRRKSAGEQSSRRAFEYRTWLLDVLCLPRTAVTEVLAGPLANPGVVKVLQGSNQDILWLQRDFGLYVVQLWDTACAARALELPSASLAHLWQRYGIPTNISSSKEKKAFQLADWRQRPLPEPLQQYAATDTHYLLYIADRLREELTADQKDLVWQASRHLSLWRYAGEPFRPSGYRSLLLPGSRRKNRDNPHQSNQDARGGVDRRLRILWEWRDATARRLDESLHFICPNHNLLLVAQNPMSSNTEKHYKDGKVDDDTFWPSLTWWKRSARSSALAQPAATELRAQVRECLRRAESGDATAVLSVPGTGTTRIGEEDEGNDALHKGDEDDDEEMDDVEEEIATGPSSAGVHSTSSAFFKPASSRTDRRGMMSPVLGTEALYQQAGWTTPQNESTTPSTGATTATGATAGTAPGSTVTPHSVGAPATGLGSRRGQSTQGLDDEEEDTVHVDLEDITTTASENEEGLTVVTVLNTGHPSGPRTTTSRRLLSVSAANRSYAANTKNSVPGASSGLDPPYAAHSLELKSPANNEGSIGLAVGGTNLQRGLLVDGYASLRAAASTTGTQAASSAGRRGGVVKDQVNAARQSSAQIRSKFRETNAVLGLITKSNSSSSSSTTSINNKGCGGVNNQVVVDQDDDEEFVVGGTLSTSKASAAARGAKTGVAAAAAVTAQEEFTIPRSMREIYKISNRNRRNKKAGGSPGTPERGTTPTNEKDRAELAKAEAILRARGADAAGFLFDAPGAGGPSSIASSSSAGNKGKPKDNDSIGFFRSVGWVSKDETNDNLMAECYGDSNAGTQTKPDGNSNNNASSVPLEYSQMGVAGALSSAVPTNNPFFNGAAMQGGPLANQHHQRGGNSRKTGGPGSSAFSRGSGGSGNTGAGSTNKSFSRGNNRGGGNMERPEKQQGRSYAYRSSNSGGNTGNKGK